MRWLVVVQNGFTCLWSTSAPVCGVDTVRIETGGHCRANATTTKVITIGRSRPAPTVVVVDGLAVEVYVAVVVG